MTILSITPSSGGGMIAGPAGLSAYELAVINGFSGTRADWLASLQGASGSNGVNGSAGETAYQVAVDNGFAGSQGAWLDSLQGGAGAAGNPGLDGIGLVIPNVAALATAVIQPDKNILLQGYYAAGDGGHSLCYYDPASSAAVDNGLVFMGPFEIGRIFRYVGYGIHTKWFGLDHSGGGTLSSQRAALKAWFLAGTTTQTMMYIDQGTIDMKGAEVFFNATGEANGGPASGFIIAGTSRVKNLMKNVIIHIGSLPTTVQRNGVYGTWGGSSSHVILRQFQAQGQIFAWNAQNELIFEELIVTADPSIAGDGGYGVTLYNCNHVTFRSVHVLRGKDCNIPAGRCNGVRLSECNEFTWTNGICAHNITGITADRFWDLEAANPGFVTTGAGQIITLANVHFEGNEKLNWAINTHLEQFNVIGGFIRNDIYEWNTIAVGSAAIAIPSSVPTSISISVPSSSLENDVFGSRVSLVPGQLVRFTDRASTGPGSGGGLNPRYVEGTVTSYGSGTLVLNCTGKSGTAGSNLGYWRLSDGTYTSFPSGYVGTGTDSLTIKHGYHVGPNVSPVLGTWLLIEADDVSIADNDVSRFSVGQHYTANASGFKQDDMNSLGTVLTPLLADPGATPWTEKTVAATTASAAIPFNVASGRNQTITLTQSNHTVSAPSGVVEGWTGRVKFLKTNSGDKIANAGSWDSHWKFPANIFPGGAPIFDTMTTSQTVELRLESWAAATLTVTGIIGPV